MKAASATLTPRRGAALAVASAGYFFVLLDVTIVNVALPGIGTDLGSIGAWAAMGGSALVAGPVLGGILVSGLGWRAIFWLNVPLAIGALLAARAVLGRGGPTSGRRLDLAGQLLGTLALVALVFFLIEGGHSGYAAPTVLACAAVAGGAAVAFLAVERRRRDPLLDPGWFGRAGFAAANAGAGLMNLGTLGALFAISLFLQQDEGGSALGAGLALLPLAAPLALLTPLSGRLVAAVGARRPAGIGLVLCGLGYAGLSVLGVDPSTSTGVLLLALAGLGMVGATPALVAGATAALGARRAGIGSAINNTSRQVGGAIGVALIGGLGSFAVALALSAAALLLGGTVALAFLEP